MANQQSTGGVSSASSASAYSQSTGGTGGASGLLVQSTGGLYKTASQPVGVLYSNDFASGSWTKVGTHTTYTFGSTIRSAGAYFAPGTLDYIYSNYLTSSEAWSFTITYTVNVTTTANYGIWPALLSLTSGAANAASFRINSVFGNTDNETGLGGLPTIWVGNHTTTWTAHGAPGTVKFASGTLVGDSITVVLSRLNTYDYNLFSTNNRTGETTTWSYTVPNVYPPATPLQEANNICCIAIGNVAGDNTITAWSYRNNEMNRNNILVIGDSKASGLYSGAVANRFANVLHDTYGKSVSVMGGPSDHAQYECLNVAEHKLMLASKAFLFIGCNDIRGGRTVAQVSANILTIKTALESVGTTVYVMTPTPEGALNLKPLRDQLIIDFPTSYIDSWTTLLGAGTAPNAALVLADAVHPNTAGHLALATLLSAYI